MISHVGFLHERLVFGRRVSILSDSPNVTSCATSVFEVNEKLKRL